VLRRGSRYRDLAASRLLTAPRPTTTAGPNVDFIANFMNCDIDPGEWARQRESEGWPILGCADHLWSSSRPYPNLWVSLATMAAATTTTMLTSSFANNLFRSPVEFAQAALQLQAFSGGRFEAGLGAGWSRDEAIGAGIEYPSPGVRAGRYIEAVQIVRSLLRTGTCTFSGEHYSIEVPGLGPLTSNPPPLVVSLGGPRTIRAISPLVDRVELKPISSVTGAGSLDVAALGTIPRSHLDELVGRVREVNPTVPIGAFVLCGVGSDPRTKSIEALLAGTFVGGFFGESAKVAESMFALADAGIDRVQVSPFNDDAFGLLAPHLFGRV
jgi:Luciferase-like monooxygenase